MDRIDYPQIPAEQGSYEDGTLILYDTKVNDDGTTSKIWNYAYNDSTKTKTVTQTFSASGALLNTLVEEMDEVDDNEYYFATTFDATNAICKRELGKIEFLGDGYMTITSAIDENGTGNNVICNIEKTRLATTGAATNNTEVEISDSDILLNSLEALPKIKNFEIGNASLKDIIDAIISGKCAIAFSDYTDVISEINKYISYLENCSAYNNAEKNEAGLVTKDGLMAEYVYDENNIIKEVKISDLYGRLNRNILFSRDENGKVNTIELTESNPDNVNIVISVENEKKIKEISMTKLNGSKQKVKELNI